MALTPITNHIDQGLARLIDRYKNKPRFAAWCASHLRQAQKLEDAVWALLALLDVDAADETRLKLLGKIVGQPQRGTLDQFRLYVKTRIFANRSNGTAPDLIHIARLLLGDAISYDEGGCKVVITHHDPIDFRDPDATVEFLRDAKMGGVGLNLVFSPDPLTARFRFCAGTSPTLSARGFAREGHPGSGGTFSLIR